MDSSNDNVSSINDDDEDDVVDDVVGWFVVDDVFFKSITTFIAIDRLLLPPSIVDSVGSSYEFPLFML